MANLKRILTIDEVKKESIRIQTGMIVGFLQSPKEEIMRISEPISTYNGYYSINNSIICFISEDEIFVTPYTRKVINTLSSANFKRKYFYVPFSHEDYPKYEKEKWYSLLENARKIRENEFIDDCIFYCDKHHIGVIDDEILEKCFKLPNDGVKVEHFFFNDCYYPIIRSKSFNRSVANKIGHFCVNKGIVVFVYRDGNTYVSKGNKILNKLRAAGYTRAEFLVPFSNGEKIVDPVLRKQWKSIKEIN